MIRKGSVSGRTFTFYKKGMISNETRKFFLYYRRFFVRHDSNGRLMKNKIAKQREKGYKTPKCNTIRFGEVLGQKRAFLIQNMFPVTPKYISALYVDRNTQTPVTIAPATEKDIVKNAKDILKLVFRGYSKLVFSDIQKTYADLKAELQTEQQKE